MAERNYTSSEILLMTKIRKSNTKCYYCGCTVEESKRTVDHKIPVSRGGLTKQDNLVMSCQKCNNEKDFLTEEEYNEFLNKANKRIEKSASVIHLTALLNTYKDILDDINRNKNKLKLINKEVLEIELIIKDSRLSASDGYKLCKMLQDNLREKDIIDKSVRDLQRINPEIEKSYQSIASKLGNLKIKIKNEYKKEYINSKEIILN